MTLGEKQEQFTGMLAVFLHWCLSEGYKIRIGEVYRTPQQAAWNAENGKGIRNSLHTKKLAIDFAYVRDINNRPLRTKAQWLPLGEFWESLGGSWGGRFKSNDYGHFSLEHNGVR